MRMIDRFRPHTYLVVLILATTAVISTSLVAGAQEPSTIELVAIDAVTDGNDATTLGPLDGCVEADVDSEVAVDIVVDAVPEDQPAIGFQLEVTYDPAILEVAAYEHELFLAGEGTYQPVEGLTDPVPDSDGIFILAILDAASNVDTNENMETGAGAIARITFNAIAPGSSEVAVDFLPPDVYPAIINTQNEPIQVDSIGAATISVGDACPEDAEPVITPLPPLEDLLPTPPPTLNPADLPDPEGGGVNYGLLAVAVAVAAVGVGGLAGGLLFYRRVTNR